MKKKVVKIILEFMIAVCLFVCGGIVLLGQPVKAEAAIVTNSGTCGENLTWALDDEGTLTISGTGAMENYEQFKAPWYKLKKSIISVKIEYGVTTIGETALCCLDNLTNVSIPNTVTTIGFAAFNQCLKLQTVYLPNSVKTIENSAFGHCWELNSINIPENVTMIGEYAFYDCKILHSINIPYSVTNIGERAFY